MRDPEGRPDHFVSVVEDISERKAAELAMARSDRRLAMASRASGLGVWEWTAGTAAVHYSARARDICGFPNDAPVTLSAILQNIHPEDREAVRARVARPRGGDDEIAAVDYRILHPDLGVRWVRAHSMAMSEPGPEDGANVRVYGTLEEITDTRDVMDRLAASEARLRLALDAGRMAVFEWPLRDPEPPLTPELRQQLGLAEGAATSVADRRARYHPDDLALASSARQRALASDDRFLDFAFRYFRPDGRMRWFQIRSEILRDRAERAHSLVGVQMDVTEQRENEERLALLMREVDHRANNLLTVVQGLVALSEAPDMESLREVLSGRVQALARAHQLLSEARWAGADLLRLVEEEMRPFGSAAPGRVTMHGPIVSLAPAEAQALALCLHELATNAAKYGALSRPEGEVSLTWRRRRGILYLTWTERGGPPVSPPRRRGFGATVLARSLSRPFGGGVEQTWAETGLIARLVLPLAATEA